MDKFITFGTKSLNLELFKKVLPYPSNSITKPIGGLWLTKYIGINANEWLTYLECNRSLFYSKFNRNACIINLKEDANILFIENLTIFNKIYEKYPSLLTDNKILDFQIDVVEIDSDQNKLFDNIDLFLRLNTKPYPIRSNSFEMWNAYVNKEAVISIKKMAELNEGKIFKKYKVYD